MYGATNSTNGTAVSRKKVDMSAQYSDHPDLVRKLLKFDRNLEREEKRTKYWADTGYTDFRPEHVMSTWIKGFGGELTGETKCD